MPTSAPVSPETTPSSVVSSTSTNHNDEEEELTEIAESLIEYLDFFPEDGDGNAPESEALIHAVGAISILAKLQPSLFLRQYEFECWNGKLYPLTMMCALDMPKDLIETIYNLCKESSEAVGEAAGICSRYVKMETLKWLLEKEPLCLTMKDSQGGVALHYACQECSLDLVNFVCSKNPDAIAVAETDGWTPMHHACRYSSVEVVKFLVEKKADCLEAETKNAITPFMLSILHDDEKVFKYLLNRFPNLSKTPNSDGELPLHFAAMSIGDEDVDAGVVIRNIRVLLENFPEAIKVKDNDEMLPIEYAAQTSNDAEAFELLGSACPEIVHSISNAAKDKILSSFFARAAKRQRTA